MDSFSIKQLNGVIDNKNHCGNYYTYSSIGETTTAGGYRVSSSADVHPCG